MAKFKENGKLKSQVIVGKRPAISQPSHDKSQQC